MFRIDRLHWIFTQPAVQYGIARRTQRAYRHFMENTRRMRQAIIPGAYDRSTLTHRQSGSMGGAASGTSGLPTAPSSMEPATILEREKEGGGGASQRRRKNARG
jgi:hypothetical protein